MTINQFRRRLRKLSPPGYYDLFMVLIAADGKIPFRKLKRERLGDLLKWPLEDLDPRFVVQDRLPEEITEWLERLEEVKL